MTHNNKNQAHRSLFLLLPAMILLLFSQVALSAIDSWSQYTPNEGGAVQAIAVDPNTADTIYVGTAANGVYKSTDGGATWDHASLGLGFLDVQTIAIDPTNSNRVYVGTNGGGIYRSTTGGIPTPESPIPWSSINTGLINLNVYAITFDPDPTRANFMYAATFGNIFASADRAGTSVTWGRQGVGAGLTYNAFHTLVADPNNFNTFYTGSFSGGVFRTTDGMSSWEQTNFGIPAGTALTTLNVRHLILSSTGNLYAGTQGGGFFIGVPTGPDIHWTAMNNGLANTTINVIVESAADPNILYAASHNNVYRSADAGNTWSAIGSELVGQRIMALDIDHNATTETIYAGTPQGIYKLTEGSTTWEESFNGISALNVTGLAIDAFNSNIQYASILGGGVLKTDNGGGGWSYVNSGIIDLKALTIAVDGSNVYVGTETDGIYKSSNGGLNWIDAEDGLGSPVVSHILDDSSSSDVLYSATSAGINRTSTGGETIGNETGWSAVNGNIAQQPQQHDIRLTALAVDPPNISNRRVYMSTKSSGIFYSEDLSSTNVDPANVNWTNISLGLDNLSIYAIAVDPNNPSTIYAGSRGSGVYKSIDRGASWSTTNTGLAPNAPNNIVHVNSIIVDPDNSNIVYAATENYGVFRSADGGESWIAANTNLSNLKIKSLTRNPTTGILYAATMGSGIYEIEFTQTNAPANEQSLITTDNQDDGGSSGGGIGYLFLFSLTAALLYILITRNSRQRALVKIKAKSN